ncbi:MAG TPA: pitrilysin family protein [Gemmatimonadaceae bacterium]|nr:pitrilysin family protein [Gemmatimonadaceae bacterium]
MKRAVVALAAVCLSHVALAQAVDRSKQPVAPPAAPFHFPDQRTTTLANGLRVIVVENHALPLVAVRAVVDVDSLEDPAGKQGLYDLTAEMLREGTAHMTADAIVDSIAALGNDVSPFRFTTITANFDRSLRLMAGMLTEPAFPAAAVDRTKAALTAAEQRQLQLAFTAPRRLLFEKLLGAEHPITHSVVNSLSETQSITRDDVVRFHDSYFRPNNTTLVVVGDVAARRVFEAARTAFGSWQRGPVPTVEYPRPPAASATTIYLFDRPNAPQTATLVGQLGPVGMTSDYAALQVLGPVLGASPGSRMHQDMREKHSYYYSGTPFGIGWRPAPLPSMLYGSVPIYVAKTDSALAAWVNEIRGMRDQPPTEHEMTLARGFLLGMMTEQLETDDSVADRIAFRAENHLAPGFYDAYVRSVAAVTPTDVLAAAKKYLDPEHLVIVMAGDRKFLEPKLAALNIGRVVVVDEK